MTNEDYDSIRIPENKPTEEYHYTERRAEMLDMIYEQGNPRSLPVTKLADRYGVSPSQISKDKRKLQEYIVESLDETRVDSMITVVIERSLEKMVEEGRHRDAVRSAMDWADYLGDRGHIDRVPEQHEVNASVTQQHEIGDETRGAIRDSLADRYEVGSGEEVIDIEEPSGELSAEHGDADE